MAAAGAKTGKPARKRRRRQSSYSISSSSDSESDESTSSESSASSKGKKKKDESAMEVDGEDSSSDSSASTSSASSSSSSSGSSSESSSSSSSGSDTDSSDSDEEDEPKRSTSIKGREAVTRPTRPRAPTLSPSPPPRTIPSFLSGDTDAGATDDRRARFRRVYMEKLVEGFGDDLQKLRESDPTLGPSKLQLLIDSLAAGMEVFNDGKRTDRKEDGVDEVGLILGEK